MFSVAALRRATNIFRPTPRCRGFMSSRPLLQAPKVKVNVDGKDVEVPSGSTVLQACEAASVHVPRFCYHDRLSIAGNCRMCLVEVEKSPKPVASCAMPIMPGMKIKTNTQMVHKAREGVMEFLLANHPLDCPICDQGGECDLQDQSMAYGSDRSRFKEFKRTVEDKNLGPFVKTIMTRCIHCTRCVRFAAEIAGVEDLGATGRGNQMEIGTYIEKVFDSELSGNVVDVCPVGALTSKPFAFTARPWELESTESIDVMDAVGSAIRVDSRGVEVMRINPRLHEDINEEWLADKSRFAYDGLKRQRLDSCMITKNGKLEDCDWVTALSEIKKALVGLKTNQVKGIVGDQVDAETMVAFKDFLNRLGCNNIESRQDGAKFDADLRANYLFNTQIGNIEYADTMLLVGTNPRMEAPIINARIRKSTVHSGLNVFSVGPEMKLNYPHHPLGNDPNILTKIADGSHPFSATLSSSQRPMIVIGAGVLRRPDAAAVLASISQIVEKYPALQSEAWNGINFLQLAAGRTAALELGLVSNGSADNRNVKFVYLLGADEFDEAEIPKGAFVVYQGHHGDRGAARANVVLPGLAYTEKDGTYVNTEGRPQRTRKAVAAVGDARPDWSIVTALADFVGVPLPYQTLNEVRARMADISPSLARVDSIESPLITPSLEIYRKLAKGSLDSTPFTPAFTNYFMTDPISRSSKNMARAVQTLHTSTNSYV